MRADNRLIWLCLYTLASIYGILPVYFSHLTIYVGRMPIPVIAIAQMREWEKATWASGQAEAEVIRRVGKCVGTYASRLTMPDDLIVILAGKGHNGEDARCAQEHLGK